MLEQTKQTVSVNGSKKIVTKSITKRHFGDNSSFGAAGSIDVGIVSQIAQYFEDSDSWTEEIGSDGGSDDGFDSNDDDDFDTDSVSTAHASAVLVGLVTVALYLKSRIV